MPDLQSVILENEVFRLVLSPAGFAESLILKETGTECLNLTDPLPFFSLTEERLYNNELKLAHPHKRTTFGAKSLRMEDGKLIVGFELIAIEAVVSVQIRPRYMLFTLTDFLVPEDAYGLGVDPIQPPVAAFRLVQLPLVPRTRFGEWLNVLWDDTVAVNVLGASPYARIDSETRRDCRVLFGETLRDVCLKNAGVALIVSAPDQLLTAIDDLERDCDLPRGVESRRSPEINRSYYWAGDINPENADTHIACAKRGGFRFMSIYYSSVVVDIGQYRKVGEYDVYRPTYPNGRADLVRMLDKIKAAGILPGLHLLHTHIGLRSRYLTPVADHRLHLKRQFTLAKPITADDTVLYVEEDPTDSPVFEKTRILRFMGELIRYESYTTEPPYRFIGCERGYNDTVAKAHDIGTIGGILDVSEFCGGSVYIDQRTSLQDEIADAVADLYNAGFTFLYFDGSEGTNPPFEINVGLAQWRIYRKLQEKPLFCEGAAKSHFSWHMLSGGNAFDTWSPSCFKEMIARHPVEQAPRMANDFTRLNFGWWTYRPGQRPDIFEYGTAQGAAWDCPGAFMCAPSQFLQVPRAEDMLETFRRWEEARASGFITAEVKEKLRHTDREHTLLINEEGQLELAEWEQVPDALDGDETVTVFLLRRQEKTCAVCWHNTGSGCLSLPLIDAEIIYTDRLGGEEISVQRAGDALLLPVEGKRYLITDLPKETLAQAFAKAKLV